MSSMNKFLAALNAGLFVFQYHAGSIGFAALAAALVVWCGIDAVRQK
jgi:hypothetical protein